MLIWQVLSFPVPSSPLSSSFLPLEVSFRISVSSRAINGALSSCPGLCLPWGFPLAPSGLPLCGRITGKESKDDGGQGGREQTLSPGKQQPVTAQREVLQPLPLPLPPGRFFNRRSVLERPSDKGGFCVASADWSGH